jgi:hypothetical protein
MAHPASGSPALRRLDLATAAEVNLRLAFNGAASLGEVWSAGMEIWLYRSVGVADLL